MLAEVRDVGRPVGGCVWRTVGFTDMTIEGSMGVMVFVTLSVGAADALSVARGVAECEGSNDALADVVGNEVAEPVLVGVALGCSVAVLVAVELLLLLGIAEMVPLAD